MPNDPETIEIDLSQTRETLVDQLHEDSMFDCLEFAVLGMVRCYPSNRNDGDYRPGEIPPGHVPVHGPVKGLRIHHKN